jgi:hypothetical protein
VHKNTESFVSSGYPLKEKETRLNRKYEGARIKKVNIVLFD